MILRLGDLELDLARHRATRRGRLLELTPKEFLLLALLLRRSGDVLSRTVIAEQVWDISFDGDLNVVDVHVRRLRSKVDDPFERKLIHTVRGSGTCWRSEPSLEFRFPSWPRRPTSLALRMATWYRYRHSCSSLSQ